MEPEQIKGKWKHLCLEGGGIKGVGLAGAACYMQEIGIWKEIQNYCGTSAGSIFALLAAIGCDPQEIKEIMFSVDFNTFKDKEYFYRKIWNLFTRYGIYSGFAFEEWAQDIIKQKLGSGYATFKDLEEHTKKGLFVITSNLSTGYSDILSLPTTPTLPLYKAVRMSMAIPFFFTSVYQDFEVMIEDEKTYTTKPCLFCDGGVFENFPIQFFDDERFCKANDQGIYINEETIGFKLDSRDKMDVILNKKPPYYQKITNIVGFIENLIGALLNVQDNYYRSTDDWRRTIFVDTLGIGTTDFDITLKQKKALFKSGYDGAKVFFASKGILK